MSSIGQLERTYEIPETWPADIVALRERIAAFHSGSVSAAELRAFRVPLGIYEQRRDGTFMLRVRLPLGAVLPHQMRTLASVSRDFGNGVLHVTTRQDIQVHVVPLDSICRALVELSRSGLCTKGGGGNTVRNITCCVGAGVCRHEHFDVGPYAVAMTEFLLDDPLSYQLPRKYKLAFSGCSNDCAAATVNDVGYIAKQQDGVAGFSVYVGGGLGAHSRTGQLLETFVAADRIHRVAEAVKRVFDKHGNRKNRNRARLRFLIEEIGLDKFRALYEAELEALGGAASPPLRVLSPSAQSGTDVAPSETARVDFAAWRQRNVRPQKQSSYYRVEIPLVLGDISVDAMGGLADVADKHGERMLRTTQWQNIELRWVHERELPAVHGELAALGLAETPPRLLRELTSCTGASTCKLGICLSRGLARAIADALTHDVIDLDAVGKLRLYVSGCPNACGRHPIAQLGFFGAARRVGGHLAPHYVVQYGGKVREGKTRLAEGNEAIPARNVPIFVKELLTVFLASAHAADFDAFLDNGGREQIAALIAQYRGMPTFEQAAECYQDWDGEGPFSLAGRGPGECGAGVFDLIEVDLASARDALEHGRKLAAVVLAARALLVTQGQEAKDDASALRLFGEHFLDAGLVAPSLRGVVEAALAVAGKSGAERAFGGDAAAAGDLVSAVRQLYDTMDPSLRFRPAPSQAAPATESAPVADVKADREENFVGVACPLNYVKTKLVLDRMAPGQVLAVLLNAEGAKNVPGSVTQDGHKVLSKDRQGDAWRVVIQKGKP